MNREGVPADDRLDEQQVVRLFRRAADLDAERGTRVSVDDLRQIARELGISNESFDLALHEVRSGVTGESDVEPSAGSPADSGLPGRIRLALRHVSAQLRTGGVALAGFGLGLIGPLTNPPELVPYRGGQLRVHDVDGVVTIMAGGIATLLAIASVIHHRRRGTPLHFQLDNLLLWGMYAQGLMVGHGRFTEDLGGPAFVLWFGFAAVGLWFTVRESRARQPARPVWTVPAAEREVVGLARHDEPASRR